MINEIVYTIEGVTTQLKNVEENSPLLFASIKDEAKNLEGDDLAFAEKTLSVLEEYHTLTEKILLYIKNDLEREEQGLEDSEESQEFNQLEAERLRLGMILSEIMSENMELYIKLTKANREEVEEAVKLYHLYKMTEEFEASL